MANQSPEIQFGQVSGYPIADTYNYPWTLLEAYVLRRDHAVAALPARLTFETHLDLMEAVAWSVHAVFGGDPPVHLTMSSVRDRHNALRRASYQKNAGVIRIRGGHATGRKAGLIHQAEDSPFNYKVHIHWSLTSVVKPAALDEWPAASAVEGIEPSNVFPLTWSPGRYDEGPAKPANPLGAEYPLAGRLKGFGS